MNQTEYNANYYLKNRDKIIAQVKEYTQKHKETKKLYLSQYYQANKEKAQKYNNEYYSVNRGEILERVKNYALTPKGREVHRHHTIKRRYQKAKLTDITSDFLLALRETTPNCPSCGVFMNEIRNHSSQATLDHIIPLCFEGTHTKNNVRFVCRHCNGTKATKTS